MSWPLGVQTFTMRVNYNESNGLPDPTGGPTDDGYIAVAVKSVPQDPLCCTGPNVTDDGAPPPGADAGYLPLCCGFSRELFLFVWTAPVSCAVNHIRHVIFTGRLHAPVLTIRSCWCKQRAGSSMP